MCQTQRLRLRTTLPCLRIGAGAHFPRQECASRSAVLSTCITVEGVAALGFGQKKVDMLWHDDVSHDHEMVTPSNRSRIGRNRSRLEDCKQRTPGNSSSDEVQVSRAVVLESWRHDQLLPWHGVLRRDECDGVSIALGICVGNRPVVPAASYPPFEKTQGAGHLTVMTEREAKALRTAKNKAGPPARYCGGGGSTQTLSADTRSTFRTSVRSLTGCNPGFFGGLARNPRKYWWFRRSAKSSR